jgi:cytochrome o ubiquinol oxidase subunit 3
MIAKTHVDDTSKSFLGFWIYLMTDCIVFASFFATYAVLRNNTNGGPTGAELFSLPFILVETMLLLTSSFTAGLAVLAMQSQQRKQALTYLLITIALGTAFVGMEFYEFNHLVQEGHSWKESGFLSAYFSLVGLHGMHIIAGLTWAITLGIFIYKKGITATNTKRMQLWSMFWHFLDIVWIFIFTFVYLIGASS